MMELQLVKLTNNREKLILIIIHGITIMMIINKKHNLTNDCHFCNYHNNHNQCNHNHNQYNQHNHHNQYNRIKNSKSS